jgi:hypothetical protein
MRTCPSCLRPPPDEARFCPLCGASLGADSGAATATDPRAGPGDTPPSDLLTRAHFLPGAILAERYRIIARLGQGAMGEVYRADDLKLGQAVALKFLLRHDAVRRGRMLTEVRLARQVTHPCVCRAYDVGEVDGVPFVTMEYVDGEDLTSLLRRIGRLPEAKAVQVALQLCAGLAAAHEQGILHRDLKPANVMIDGRGRVRITDFGLAILADQVRAADVRSGTPAYMAPEQFAGREVTVRSDLYALGLVLYEIFTGRPAYPKQTADEAGMRASLVNPSSYVKNLDLDVERIILRCLEPDPGARPPSAHAVAAALPGGDPLAAALAAGETPTPEMVAAAGGVGGLRTATAAASLVLLMFGLGAVLWLADQATPLRNAPLDKPPDALRDHAEEILKELGHVEAAGDAAHGFDYERESLEYRAKGREGSAETPEVTFWYRRSPGLLVPDLVAGSLSFTNSAATVPGMASVRLAPDGRLLEVLAVARDDQPASAWRTDWRALFARARLDWAEFHPVEPLSIPPVYADERQSWQGTSGPGRTPLRVEAGSFRGRLIYFKTTGPWSQLSAPAPRVRWWYVYGYLVLFVVAAILARRNVRLGRADVKGALRLLIVLFLTGLLGSYVLPLGSRLFRLPVTSFLFVGVAFTISTLGAVSYLALEPLVRRHWPDALTSWARLVDGRLRDPRVGKDLLLGSVSGLVLAALELWETILGGSLTRMDLNVLLGGRQVLAHMISSVVTAGVGSTAVLLIFVMFRVLLRRPWPAAIAATVVTGVLRMGAIPTTMWALAFLASVLMIVVLLRLGLFAAMVALWVHTLLAHAVVTAHLGAWYADMTIASLAAVLSLGFCGFFVTSARWLAADATNV